MSSDVGWVRVSCQALLPRGFVVMVTVGATDVAFEDSGMIFVTTLLSLACPCYKG